MTHTFEDVMDAIEAAENSLPVNEWLAAGIQVWPLLRIRLYFSGLKHDFDAAHTSVSSRIKMPRTVAKLADIAQGRLRKVLCSLRDRRGVARGATEARVLFFSDGVSFAKFDGKWLERFCDPLIDQLRANGVVTQLWVPTHNYYTPRYSPSEWIQSGIDSAQLAAMARLMTGGAPTMHLPRHAEFLDLLRGKGFATDDFAAGRIGVDAARIAAVADFFRRRLARLQPRLVFIVSYYGIEGYALVKACRDLGIPTVDLQHGVQGRLHPGYGRFTAAPESGYDVLPDFFWTWSSSEADVIDSWAAARRTRHKAIVGGNPWLETWLAADSELVRKYDAHIDELRRHSGAQRHVLVTLQFGLAFDSFLAPLSELARKAGSQWHWWIRLHPGMLGLGADIERRLRERGMSNFALEPASQLPLYALLRRMDLHMTYSSSVVLEAAEFGVPSLVCSDAGSSLFSQQIAAGQARYLALDQSTDVRELDSVIQADAQAHAGHRSLSSAALLQLCDAAGIAVARRRA